MANGLKSKFYSRALALMHKGGSEEAALDLLHQAIEEGDFRAHYAVGTWYLFGRHVKKDQRMAVKYFKAAAANDIAEAAFDLAVCYEKGEGVVKDAEKAAACYLRALRCGDPSAAQELRRLFYWGIGVKKNRLLAGEFAKLRSLD